MTKNLTLINSTIESDTESVKTAIIDSVKSCSVKVDFKQGISASLKNTLSTAYGVKMQATNMRKRYSGNLSYYMSKISELDELETRTEQQDNELKEYRDDLGKMMARWAYWYNRIKASYRMESLEKDESLYNAYVAKRESRTGYANALKAYFSTHYELTINDETVNYINDTIGFKRAAMTKADERQVEELNSGEYFLFLTDTMIELAMAKKQMNLQKACEVVDGDLIDIEELDSIIVVEKRTDKTSTKTMIETLRSVGVSIAKNAKKADAIKAWNKAKKEGVFAEYQPYNN